MSYLSYETKKVFGGGGGWVTPIIMSALVSLRVKERHKETRDGHRTQDTELDNFVFDHAPYMYKVLFWKNTDKSLILGRLLSGSFLKWA